MSRGRVSGGGESSEDRLNKIRVHLEKRVIDLECDIAQLRESSRTPAACGHMQNFQIGDEYGHFSCLVCENDRLRKENKNLHNLSPDMRKRGYKCDCKDCAGLMEDNLNLVNSLELEGHRIENLARENNELRNVCAEAYQLAGAYGADVKALDNLYAAAQGNPIPHESFLPVHPKDRK